MEGAPETPVEARGRDFELKQAEESAKEACAIIHSITENTEDMIAAADQDYRYIFFNDAYRREFKRLWGREIHQGTSMPEAMAALPDMQRRAIELWRRALNGESFSVIEEFGPPDDRQYYDLRFNPLRDLQGRVFGASHIFRNVTQTMRAQARLRESEARQRETAEALAIANRELQDSEAKFRSIFEQAAIGIGRVEFQEARWIDVNEAFCSMLGYTRDEMLRTPWPEMTHPEDLDIDLVPFQRMAKGELDSYSLEKRFIHKQGHHVWALLTLSLVRKPDGRPDYEVAVIEDISERKRAEEQVLESRARLQAALGSMTDAVAISDAEGRLVELNEAFASFHRFANKNASSRSAHEYPSILEASFEDGSPVPVEQWVVPRALRGETARNAVYELRRKDTGEAWTGSYSFAPIRDEQGEITGSVMVCRDITEQREAALALEKAVEQLRDADRQKDEFLAVLSHELRNPLAPIKYSMHILELASPGGEQAAHALRVIDRQVDQMSRLIDDLLDLTRISRGKILLQCEELDLREILHAVYEDLATLFIHRAIACDIDLPDEPVPVYGDRARLAQIIANLIENAAKFSEEGGRVAVSLRRETGEQVVLKVRDEGIGISFEHLETIFDPFVQVKETVARSGGGLGLGLALVKGLVEMHYGRVSADSEGEGTGAEFTVELPLHATEETKPEPSLELRQAPSRRVLIIEDNRDTAESLQELLELMGHSVEVAFDGEEGLAKAVSVVPDVVLCDIGLPKIDGYGVAERLRAVPRLRSIHLVALSGYARPEDLERSRKAGFYRHLAKPPRFEDLKTILAEAPSLSR